MNECVSAIDRSGYCVSAVVYARASYRPIDVVLFITEAAVFDCRSNRCRSVELGTTTEDNWVEDRNDVNRFLKPRMCSGRKKL